MAVQYPGPTGGRNQSGTGQSGAGRKAGGRSQTGASNRFSWATMNGRAPAAAQLSWINRQFEQDANVAKAKSDNDLARAQSGEDFRLARADRAQSWVDQRLGIGSEAAASGNGRNPAMLAPLADAANAYASDVTRLRWERTKARDNADAALAQALRERLAAKMAMTAEEMALADAEKLVEAP